ncbi:cilia- and flagella-associated protein 206 [Ischnura elegans]|uniref:cilia- and flagella-associated protein 206 n=1 Tax=Ischnura elegans TaxID=197161 RepID=UPI001ED89F87|nr:cilia- and flagella-associated protein 206 [Ischnura elegans]XP_046383753.1 cilia- and flagella-associated protein 206 [Ischnura elegans]XP_046383754.1 cilia- and flagella-associated protein 206 [Ischnura elegans]XP_046383755.1 cilia- and flagella-associated protein 206 [Ischnura elegans]XP_046383756.1 cilia- and flagella-associated protein 206 [Ischnura elegans]XP_046383757.1 cilia- and flagella-associated protein 206 [Ischnura elegans]
MMASSGELSSEGRKSVASLDTEQLLKSVVVDIVKQCSKKGIIISKNCAAYLVTLMVKRPEFLNLQGQEFGKEDMKKLQELCLEKCSKICTLANLQMQAYFNVEVVGRAQVIEENRENRKSLFEPIFRDFLSKFPQNPEDIEKSFNSLVALIILSSGIGTLTNSLALRETAVALQSVFSALELTELLMKPYDEQVKQVDELTAIVSGVRLFNRDCNRGGHYIDDLPEILSRDVETMQGTLQTLMQKLMFKILLLTRAVENHFCKSNHWEPSSNDAGNGPKKFMQSSNGEETVINGGPKLEESENIKDALITAHQFEFFLRSLESQVEEVQKRMVQLKEQLRNCLAKIHSTVSFRSAIPTVEIYPLFIDLYDVWRYFQDEIYSVNYINSITWNINTHAQVLDSLDNKIVKQMIGEEHEDRKKSPEISLSAELIPEIELITYDAVGSAFEDLPVELNGFCIWCFVHGHGALIPGNPKLGLCRYNNFYYSTSSAPRMIEFGQNPQSYIYEASLILKKKPELSTLLSIQDEIEPSDIKIGHKSISSSDSAVQTELHPVESYISPNYSWNEWDYRRHALQLVRLRKCLTTSAQTGKSHWRQEAWVNVSLPHKERWSQTKRQSASNVPQPRRYAFGLRGKQGEPHMVDLTRPVDE